MGLWRPAGYCLILRLPIRPDMTADSSGVTLRYRTAYDYLFQRQIDEWCADMDFDYSEAYDLVRVRGSSIELRSARFTKSRLGNPAFAEAFSRTRSAVLLLLRGKAFGTPLLRIEGDVDPDDAFTLEHADLEAFDFCRHQIILDLGPADISGSLGLAVLFSLVRWARAKKGRRDGHRAGPGSSAPVSNRSTYGGGQLSLSSPTWTASPMLTGSKEVCPRRETV